MDAALVARATAAAASVAGALGLQVDDAVVLQNSNKLALRLLPCDVFARVALMGQEVAALEIELSRRLAELGTPVAALEPRVASRVYEADGYAITLWTYYRTVSPGKEASAEYAAALEHLHAGMRQVEIVAPHFTERAAEAEGLVVDPVATPALDEADRGLLLATLRGSCELIGGRGAVEQLLHGEPHPGNLLTTSNGPLFIDFETCCRGPVEFDVAHVPDAVSAHYPGVDRVLLEECRRLVLAMVAAWRWDVHDEFPDGHQVGRDLLALLRAGPPWPALGALTGE